MKYGRGDIRHDAVSSMKTVGKAPSAGKRSSERQVDDAPAAKHGRVRNYADDMARLVDRACVNGI